MPHGSFLRLFEMRAREGVWEETRLSFTREINQKAKCRHAGLSSNGPRQKRSLHDHSGGHLGSPAFGALPLAKDRGEKVGYDLLSDKEML